jgi:hypothetical protein
VVTFEQAFPVPVRDEERSVIYIPDILQMMGAGPNLKMTIPRKFHGRTLTAFGSMRHEQGPGPGFPKWALVSGSAGIFSLGRG